MASRSPQIANTTWGRSLRDGAAVMVVRGDRVALPFKLTGDPVTPESLPIATGTQAPSTHGSAPIVAATRSPAQTLGFLRDAGLLPALDVLSRAPSFLKPNLDDLGPDATLTTADAKVFTVRLTPPDPSDWATKLDRLDALSGLIRFAGLANVRIDKRDGVYTIEQDGELGRPRRRLRPRRRCCPPTRARTSRRRRPRPRSRRLPARPARSPST